MSRPAESFALALLAHLRERDPAAASLRIQPGPRARGAVVGIDDDGEFVPLLKLDAPSAAYNVMSLFIYHHDRWTPTCQRGTPTELTDLLAGPLRYVWALAVTAQGFDGGPSVQ